MGDHGDPVTHLEAELVELGRLPLGQRGHLGIREVAERRRGLVGLVDHPHPLAVDDTRPIEEVSDREGHEHAPTLARLTHGQNPPMREFSSSSHLVATLLVHRGLMSPRLKAVVALVLVVPIAAYVAVSLSPSGAREPADRSPLIINDATSPVSPKTPKAPGRTAPTAPATPSTAPVAPTDPGSPTAPSGSSAPPATTHAPPPTTTRAPDDDAEEPVDDTARVVTPHPTTVDDGDDDGADDDSGSGDDADDAGDD
ncbi:hypothetical protein [Nocardioides sp. B-3]|uniref:hypothetical protein n=1 Tax=Nocardioides sp. B-3 TaxID=2895565 RepID=UPI0021532DFE|nr:hypothetical protein [Nocardioides sp. B-3]UUZ58613.1 hypothetical protein LP418_21100 [Nocardioides sp. B-3]